MRTMLHSNPALISETKGVEKASDIIAEISENVKTCKCIDDGFIYTNTANRLSYLIGSDTQTVTTSTSYSNSCEETAGALNGCLEDPPNLSKQEMWAGLCDKLPDLIQYHPMRSTA
ncbi:hypothetical protein DFH11DRAFT_1815152 [Phellopilus nigrolimitatus]|nr:hypothetical protein DFH11DRAFT_1815152 [Phellopilus nigrolimitatus]